MAPSFAGWAIPPKDDLEHLPRIDFEKGRNLRQPPPVRSGVPMANGTGRVVLISGASFGIRVILIEPSYVRTRLDSNAARAERRIDAYAAQRRRTAAAITRNTNAGLKPEVI